MKWLRPLGNTGMQVSALGLGTVKFGRNEALKYPAAFTLPDERSLAALLGQAIRQLQATYQDVVHGRDLGFSHWLTWTEPARVAAK